MENWFLLKSAGEDFIALESSGFYVTTLLICYDNLVEPLTMLVLLTRQTWVLFGLILSILVLFLLGYVHICVYISGYV